MPLVAGPYKEIDGRRTMRSVADALAEMHNVGGIFEGETAVVVTMGMRLPDGSYTGVVSVVGPPRPNSVQWIVKLPPSSGFTARTTLGVPYADDIQALDKAVSDADGNVRLANGQFVHRVQLRAAPFYEFDSADHAIVRVAVQFLGAEERCFRPLDTDQLPGVEVFDYSLLRGVRIPRLKLLQRYVTRHLPDVTPTDIALALRRAGMKLPRSG